MISIPKLLNESKQLAIAAGNLIRQVNRSGNLGVQVKSKLHGVEDYVTRADVQAQQIIVEGLRKHWPQLCIVAEEESTLNVNGLVHPFMTIPTTSPSTLDFKSLHSLLNVPLHDVVVWVDPLDATREFTKGTNLQCVFCLIGISILGKPVAGVMHQPFSPLNKDLGRTICGIVGGKVEGLHFTSSSPSIHHQKHGIAAIERDNNTQKEKGLVVTTTASHHTPQNETSVNSLNPASVIRIGGAGYKAALVMDKIADVYLYDAGGCKLWDTCAPHAIITAIGGKMTTAKGQDIVYSLQHLHVPSLVASLTNHSQYISMLERSKQ